MLPIPDGVKEEVAGRAGAKAGWQVVMWSNDDHQPPTLVNLSAKAHRRIVTVGREWMRLKAPKLWAAVIAARLIGGPTLSGTVTGRFTGGSHD